MRIPERNLKIKIRVGQVWRDRRTGILYRVNGKRDSYSWAISKVGYRGKNNHGITEKDLKLRYELV